MACGEVSEDGEGVVKGRRGERGRGEKEFEDE